MQRDVSRFSFVVGPETRKVIMKIAEAEMKKLLALLVLAACGPASIKNAPSGEFQGTLFVMWVGETQSGLGDGTFVFVPSKDPLIFKRSRPDATVKVIQPGIMYTDGGSIPQFAQVFKGFSPWGYAPAYMVHDWLFVARRCKDDPSASEAEKQAGNMPFPETGDIAAEAIQTLLTSNAVRKDDIAPVVISGIVSGPITRKLWEEPGACGPSRIKPEHQEMVCRSVPDLPICTKRAVLRSGPAAQVIQTISFN